MCCNARRPTYAVPQRRNTFYIRARSCVYIYCTRGGGGQRAHTRLYMSRPLTNRAGRRRGIARRELSRRQQRRLWCGQRRGHAKAGRRYRSPGPRLRFCSYVQRRLPLLRPWSRATCPARVAVADYISRVRPPFARRSIWRCRRRRRLTRVRRRRCLTYCTKRDRSHRPICPVWMSTGNPPIPLNTFQIKLLRFYFSDFYFIFAVFVLE